MAAARTGTTSTAGAGAGTEAEFSSAAQRERRQRILDATLALASRGGYDAVQMRAVADRADVALGTLYRYFASKESLFLVTVDRVMRRLRERIDARVVHIEDALERISQAVHEYLSFFADNPGRFTRSWFAWANALFSELVLAYCGHTVASG